MIQLDPAHDALLVVDVQNDFCSGGALAVPDGDQVVDVANRLVHRFEHLVFSRDWHPPDHCSFAAAPRFVDRSWPVHCVARSHGAQLHPALQVPPRALLVDKGTQATHEAYSAFDDTGLAGTLRARGVQRVFVLGLATDYCVKATTLDALRYGFSVVLLRDGVRAVDVPPGSGAAALAEVEAAGATLLESAELTPGA